MAKGTDKTNVMRLLETEGIPYTPWFYEHEGEQETDLRQAVVSDEGGEDVRAQSDEPGDSEQQPGATATTPAPARPPEAQHRRRQRCDHDGDGRCERVEVGVGTEGEEQAG